MNGLMQDWPLLCHKIIDYAAIQHGDRQIISRSVEGPIVRTTYAETRARALKIAQLLHREGFGPGERIATLALPPNDDAGNGYVAGKSTLAVSPDGTRIAFTWRIKRGNNTDTHVYTARTDGSELRQMTAVADASSPLDHHFGSPAWSPDGQWLAFVLYMSGASSAPVWPQAEIGPWRVTGTTGCDASPVYILSAAQPQARSFTWPTVVPDIAVKMRAMGGNTGEWVTSCSTVRWLP